MEEIKNSSRINIGYVIVIAIVALTSFFIGYHYAAKRMVAETDPITLRQDLPSIHHIESIKSKTGWDDPVGKLKNDLVDNPELIPHDPVLGGKMGFYNRDEIFLLNDKWVLASFEDGHIGGNLLLEFEITPEKEIDWQVLGSYLE
jgi:hypothetical protein